MEEPYNSSSIENHLSLPPGKKRKLTRKYALLELLRKLTCQLSTTNNVNNHYY